MKTSHPRTTARRIALGPLLALTFASAVAVENPAPHAGAPSIPAASLYKRLGGYDALAAMTDDLVGRVLADAQLAQLFEGLATESKGRFRQRVLDQLCAVSGGPCVYIGRDPAVDRPRRAITQSDWQAGLKALAGSLDRFKVPDRERDELLAAVSGLESEVVGESPATSRD